MYMANVKHARSTTLPRAGKSLRLRLALCATVSLIAQHAAAAQTSAGAARTYSQSSSTIQEVVVTASKRSESLSKTPLAVSALSQSQLSQEGVTSTKDLSRAVPNLELGVAGIGDGVQINLRGIESSVIFQDGDPAVATYIDGVNIPRTQGLNGDLYDLARVEVLRGPQGTLYGRNATAGSLNILTASPTHDLSGHLDVSYGNYDDVASHGSLNLPVTDTLAIRIAFATHRNDGYFDDANIRSNYDSADDYAGRLTALWTPTSRFSWRLSVSDYDSRGTSNGGVSTNSHGGPANGLPVFDQPANPAVNPTDHVNNLGVRSRMEFVIDDTVSVDYIAGFGSVTYANTQASLGSPIPPVLGATVADNEHSNSLNQNYSQEIDVNYNNGPLRNIAGGSYFFERNHNIANFTVYNFGIDYDFTVPGTYQESYGVFDQVTWSLKRWLRLTGGVRYSDDRKNRDGEFISYCRAFSPYTGSYSVNPACFEVIPDSAKAQFSRVNYKVGVDADLTAQTLVFATISTGYKAGGINDATAPGQKPVAFQPEDVTNYEGGLKTRFFGNRLQVNTDVFYMDYRNLQVTQIENPIGELTVNAASASIYGVEVESTWVATPNDRVSGFANYLHATYDQFNNATDALTGITYASLAGHELPQAPRSSLQVRYTHDIHLADGALVSGTAQIYYQDHTFLREFNLPVDRVPSYSKTRLDLSYKTPDRHWLIDAYVDNLEDNAIRSAVFPLAGNYLSYYNPPRTFGVRLSGDF